MKEIREDALVATWDRVLGTESGSIEDLRRALEIYFEEHEASVERMLREPQQRC